MKIAVQMDNISNINVQGDTSFALMLEAQAREHEVFYYTPDKLSLFENQVFAHMHKIMLYDDLSNYYKLEACKKISLNEFDVILLRQDPPFDMNYISTTYLLDFVSDNTLILNNPFWVRNSPEKLFVMQFSEFMPKTLIARDIKDVVEFREQQGDIIIKPLYGNGGAGVFYLKQDDKNLNSLLEIFDKYYNEPFIVQDYLERVVEGDKRIILIDGEAVGAINRVPAKSELRSNMHVGGVAQHCDITQKERELCAVIAPWLQKRELYLCGIDIIGDKITEINVTSPTGIREIKKFSDIDVAEIFWDKIEKRLLA